jgi:hypothetical protein
LILEVIDDVGVLEIETTNVQNNIALKSYSKEDVSEPVDGMEYPVSTKC